MFRGQICLDLGFVYEQMQFWLETIKGKHYHSWFWVSNRDIYKPYTNFRTIYLILNFRLLIAPLEHVSDIHLYYNMVSLAWKGMKLEKHRRYGTIGFIGLVSFFAVLTGIMYTVLSYGAAELLDDMSYAQQCSIGFSGILFALKVVANNEESAESQGMI